MKKLENAHMIWGLAEPPQVQDDQLKRAQDCLITRLPPQKEAGNSTPTKWTTFFKGFLFPPINFNSQSRSRFVAWENINCC